MFGQSSGGGWTFRRYDKWLNHQGKKKIYHFYSCQHSGRWYSYAEDWKHGGVSFYFGFHLSVIPGETAKHLTVFGHLFTPWQQPTGLKSKLWNRRRGGNSFGSNFIVAPGDAGSYSLVAPRPLFPAARASAPPPCPHLSSLEIVFSSPAPPVTTTSLAVA